MWLGARYLKNGTCRYRTYGFVFLSSAFFGTVVILIAVRGVVKPIKQLSSASREVAQGHFDISVDIKKQDEIGRLAADFNIMVQEINSIDRMRREFVSNVSHEIRTPITSIKGFARLINENAEINENVREYSNTIIQESERLIDLSSNLLRLSELDSQIIHEQTEFSLDEQIRQVILSLETLWEVKKIEFDLELIEIAYTGDEDLLRQVWLNLIQNAINFSHDGGTIKIELNKTNGKVCVKITDYGFGIPEEDVPRVFDRFYKGDTSQKSKGNGLGLSIVQKIVQTAGGTISVKSKSGKGTAVTVKLP
jgi:signal transduction histidine kinase